MGEGGGVRNMGFNLGAALPFEWGCRLSLMAGGEGGDSLLLHTYRKAAERMPGCTPNPNSIVYISPLFITCPVYNVVCAHEMRSRKQKAGAPCSPPRQADLRLER